MKSKPKAKSRPAAKAKAKPKAKPRPKLKPKPIPKPKPKAKPKSKTPVKKAPQKQAFFPAPAAQEPRVSYPVKKEKSGRSPVKIIIILLVLALIAFLGYRFFPEIKSAFQKFGKAPETAGVKEAVPEKQAEVAEEKKTVEEKPVVEQKPVKVEDESGYYVVQPKDSLVSISESISGKYDDWKKLFENNKDRIKSPTLIYPGQKLKVSGIEKSEKK
ncbi:MAG: LysM peptidoglycan-binding domain-containing protein [Spirochaetes bacterium]|nr:LysM peptidoglycan-binding domain-containing protein [Spirochaetota bacterium]